MITIGIDPGLTGGIAFILPTDDVVLEDLPTTPVRGDPLVKNRIEGFALARIVRQHCPRAEKIRVFCEAVHTMGGKDNAMQTQGSLMRTLGALEGIFDVLGLPCEMVQPQTWQGFYGLRGKKDEARDRGALPASIVLATRLYASAAPQLTRVKDHNKAEALLIAHFGRRTIP